MNIIFDGDVNLHVIGVQIILLIKSLFVNSIIKVF